MQDTVNILGTPFSKMTMDQTVRHIAQQVDRHGDGLFHIITGNPEIVMSSQQDSSLRQIALEADLITADGIGIVLAARWKGEPVPERVSGIDLMIRLLEEGSRQGWSVFLLGADEETNRKAAEVIAGKYQGLKIAGRHNGYFGAEDEERIVADIAAAAPDLLFVALGAPRAERWIYQYKSKLQAKVAMGVGGSFDVVAGKVKRAPVIWQKLNLEWLHRLLSQPSRWRRQLVLPRFAVKAYLHRKD